MHTLYPPKTSVGIQDLSDCGRDSHCHASDFSEYPAECDKRRVFISGFNGSAGSSTPKAIDLSSSSSSTGTAIVTKDKAYLFTDGRYFLQAEQQLDK